MFFQLNIYIFNPFRKWKELEDFKAFPAKGCVFCIEMFSSEFIDLIVRIILLADLSRKVNADISPV